MMTSWDECCFLINMPLRNNPFTELLFCVFAGLPVCVAQRANIKLRRDGVCRSVSAMGTLQIGLLTQYRPSGGEERTRLTLQSQKLTRMQTHFLRLNIQPQRLPFLPVLTLFLPLWCSSCFYGDSTRMERGELRHFVLSVGHCVNKQLLHIKLELWKYLKKWIKWEERHIWILADCGDRRLSRRTKNPFILWMSIFTCCIYACVYILLLTSFVKIIQSFKSVQMHGNTNC